MHTNVILMNKRCTHAQSNYGNTKLKAWFRCLLRHPARKRSILQPLSHKAAVLTLFLYSVSYLSQKTDLGEDVGRWMRGQFQLLLEQCRAVAAALLADTLIHRFTVTRRHHFTTITTSGTILSSRCRWLQTIEQRRRWWRRWCCMVDCSTSSFLATRQHSSVHFSLVRAFMFANC